MHEMPEANEEEKGKAMNDGSELAELQASNAFDITSLNKRLNIQKAQTKDAYRQLTEAWKALEYWSGMDPMEAIKAHNYIKEE